MSKFVINIDDGSVAFRDEYTDRQINMKPIPDSVVKSLVNGEVTKAEVVKAVNAKLRESGEFDDVDKYQKERAKLNMHKIKYDLAEEKKVLPDRSSEEISLDDVMAVKNGVEPKDPKKARAKRLSDAIDGAPTLKI